MYNTRLLALFLFFLDCNFQLTADAFNKSKEPIVKIFQDMGPKWEDNKLRKKSLPIDIKIQKLT